MTATNARRPLREDQLLLPVGLASTCMFTSVKLSQHTLTGDEIVRRFTMREVWFEEQATGEHLVEVR